MSQKVAFIGSGLIGAGLGVNAALNGYDVYFQTRKNTQRAESLISSAFDIFIEKEVITEEERVAAEERCHITTSIEEAVTGAFFIQESGPEKLELKHEILAEIEKYALPDAIIASSTSGLSITKIFENAKHPENCMGGHPYNPSYILPLVEITKGERTSEEGAQKAFAFYQSIGKEPVILNKEISGFITNRFQRAIHREVVELVTQGVCTVEAADKAMVYSVGLRWGIIGQFMTLHLGAMPEGVGHFNEKYHIDPTLEDKGLATLASWTHFPDGWEQMAQQGIDAELANRAPETGTNEKGVEEWRDRMMIDMLKLHGKL